MGASLATIGLREPASQSQIYLSCRITKALADEFIVPFPPVLA